MKIHLSSPQVGRSGVRVLVLATAAAGIAFGRWVVPAGDGTFTGLAETSAYPPAGNAEMVADDDGVGHVIGIDFGALEQGASTHDVTACAAADSPPEGHVLGICFK